MLETALNAVWLVFASGALIAAPRCTPRMRVALLCALALLFPIISITDDVNAERTSPVSSDQLAAIIVSILIGILVVAFLHGYTVRARAYAICLTTPSDPRSPPRARF